MAMVVNKEVEMESGGSGSLQLDGAASCGEEQNDDHLYGSLQQQQQNSGQPKKKRYHRHTTHQIQEMEA